MRNDPNDLDITDQSVRNTLKLVALSITIRMRRLFYLRGVVKFSKTQVLAVLFGRGAWGGRTTTDAWASQPRLHHDGYISSMLT